MESTVRILRRFISSTVLISILLLLLNGIVLVVWFSKGMSTELAPATLVRQVSEQLQPGAEGYALGPAASELLSEQHVWAMLVLEDGSIGWSYQLPDDLQRAYSLTDVAKWSRGYLQEYPVFSWEHPGGLVVIGYPGNSLAKYQYILPVSWVEGLISKLGLILAGNMLLAVLLSLWIGSRLIQSIRPLTEGIQALAEDREVRLETKGILADLAERINHVSRLLRHKKDAIQSRDAARSNWVAGISHDIRTPLSMILGHASDLEDNEALPPEQQRQAVIIRQQAVHLRELVQDLNLVSKLEYEMQPLNRQPLRLSRIARRVATELINNGLDGKYTVDLEVANEGVQVLGDERLLLRAITNLVHNSVRHNPEGCHITIAVLMMNSTDVASDAIDTMCCCRVSDDGQGIEARRIPWLLQLPFSRYNKSQAHREHGLGLPMAAQIAKAHQGRLVLENEEGGGLRAILMLPCWEHQYTL
ncbi:sensor histidine kinase [Paenibacillus massiliensis]|uniref:sensor histidine kinase n=1 Tax=Paenibacillus massiliensis TaxID=225917 RepID=UPI000379FBDB|nr:HAMP domain-containing sensor histidine kinase [Paenibacillus massiliensis]